jgi:hypothetical protein
MEPVALGAIVASCLAIDLTAPAMWLAIDNDAYGKIVGLAFVWSFFARRARARAAVVNRRARVRPLHGRDRDLGRALVASWLIVTASEDDVVLGTTSPIDALPIQNDSLLRALGALLVLLAASWFGALAASRIGGQTLKRTLTTSPSSTT